MVKRYRTVKLPAKMLEAVEQLVKEHPEYGYSSIADFVKDSVRHHYLWSVHRIKIVEE
jgi:Arc/MetJ-type ribon-helix-helix transcriptional regulator